MNLTDWLLYFGSTAIVLFAYWWIFQSNTLTLDAAAHLMAAFEPERTALERAVAQGEYAESNGFNVRKTLLAALPRHRSAVILFRNHLPTKKRADFDAAWYLYHSCTPFNASAFKIPKKDRYFLECVSFGTAAKGTIRALSRMNAVLAFATYNPRWLRIMRCLSPLGWIANGKAMCPKFNDGFIPYGGGGVIRKGSAAHAVFHGDFDVAPMRSRVKQNYQKNLPKVSPWFTPDVKPIHHGMYETTSTTPDGPYSIAGIITEMMLWNGNRWSNPNDEHDEYTDVLQERFWRGLACDPTQP